MTRRSCAAVHTANALDVELAHQPGDLVVADARGDGGPMFKRLMPRARGMAYMIRRRSSHISIGLADPNAPAEAATPKSRNAAPQPATNPRGR